MKFLTGASLDRKIASLMGGKSPLKAAVAHWGAASLEMAGLDLGRKDVQVICRLQDGRSSPQALRALKGIARQDDRLNAKVIWTPEAAVVGSRDFAANGTFREEHLAGEFVDAGVLVEDPEELAAIAKWFDDLWVRSRPISDGELRKAEEARRAGPSPEVVDLSPSDLDDLRLAVVTYTGESGALRQGMTWSTDIADMAGRTAILFRKGEDGKFHDPEIALVAATPDGLVQVHLLPALLPRFSVGRASLSRLRSRLVKNDPLSTGPTLYAQGFQGAWIAASDLLGR